jgi:hypothetical protein
MMLRWLRPGLLVAFSTVALGAATAASAEPRLGPMMYDQHVFHPGPLPPSHPSSPGVSSHAPEIHAGALGGALALVVGGTLMLGSRKRRKGSRRAG